MNQLSISSRGKCSLILSEEAQHRRHTAPFEQHARQRGGAGLRAAAQVQVGEDLAGEQERHQRDGGVFARQALAEGEDVDRQQRAYHRRQRAAGEQHHQHRFMAAEADGFGMQGILRYAAQAFRA
jgi:hypothetical protein